MNANDAKIIKCLQCGKWERRGDPCDKRAEFVRTECSDEKLLADLTELYNGLARVASRR